MRTATPLSVRELPNRFKLLVERQTQVEISAEVLMAWVEGASNPRLTLAAERPNDPRCSMVLILEYTAPTGRRGADEPYFFELEVA